MISVGTNEEKSICIWNTNNFTVIDSKSLKFGIFDLKLEPNVMINSITTKSQASISLLKKSTILYFVSAGLEVVSFWRMDSNNKLEGYHIKLEDITREKNNYITAIEITPYIEKVKNSFVLLGTFNGSILLLEKERKQLVKKYLVSQCPLLNIIFSYEKLIITTDSPVIYSWSIPFNKIDEDTALDFIKDTKENNASVMFLDKNITAVDFSNDGKEGLVSTENGGIYYVNIKENNFLKIINSHLNSEINCLSTKSKNQLVSCSDDGTLRGWTMDSYDQKFEFNYYSKEEKCDTIEENIEDSVAIVLFKSVVSNQDNNNFTNNLNYIQTENINNISTSVNQFNPIGIQTCLRVYNLEKLKLLGKITLPENGIYINNFKLIFNGKGLICTTYQDKVFVLDFQNWDPLSVLYTETNSSFIPKNQQFKSLDSLNVNKTFSFCSMSFSNGTIILLGLSKKLDKIDTEIIDKFNLFEYQISKSEDLTTAELFKNLTKYRTNYITSGVFSKKWEGILFCFHECLQFLFFRDFKNKEVSRRIPLGLFPLCLTPSFDEEYFCVGTKEGLNLLISKNDNSISTGFTSDIFKGHSSGIKSVAFSHDKTQLITVSHSEIIVWSIKN